MTTPAPTDADLIRHCAEIMGWQKQGRWWTHPAHGSLVATGAPHPFWRNALSNLNAAFRVAVASGQMFGLNGEQAMSWEKYEPHDGTPESAARALVVAVLRAAGRI